MTLQPGNPMTKVLVSIVVFEVVVFGLAFAGMVQVSQVPVATAAWATVAACVLALASAATLRSPLGYYLGWATQLVGVLLGVLTPWMYLMGGIFALIWVGSFALGKKLDNPASA